MNIKREARTQVEIAQIIRCWALKTKYANVIHVVTNAL